jgi:hypothetical protein
VTVTAWIQVTGAERKGTQELISTGSGSGPGIRVSGTNLVLKGSANGIIRRDAIRPNAGWMFVAGVYDYANGTYTLYSRNRGVDKKMGTSRKPAEEAIWVGAFNDGLANAATNIVIDDVRTYGRLLSKDDFRSLQAGGGTLNALAPTNLQLPAPAQIPGDMFDPTAPAQIPGDMFDPTEPTQIPGDMFDPTEPTQIPDSGQDDVRSGTTVAPPSTLQPGMVEYVPTETAPSLDPDDRIATQGALPELFGDLDKPIDADDVAAEVDPEDQIATQGVMPELFGDPVKSIDADDVAAGVDPQEGN